MQLVHWLTMQLKYSGYCVVCGNRISANEKGQWSPGLKAVRHLHCGNNADLADELKRKAIDYIIAGKIDEAKNSISDALKIEPANTEYLYEKANELFADKQYEKSAFLYDMIIEKQPNSIYALINKGAAFHSLGRYTDAIVCYDKVLELDERNEAARKNKELAINGFGRDEEVVTYGEDASLENKETFRYDIKTKSPNPKVEEETIIAVCAFLNSNGGKVRIGISDKRTVIGLERDYSTFKETDRNEDFFELHIREKMDAMSKNRLIVSKLTFAFPIYDGKRICEIEVPGSKEPVYFKSGQDEQFYIRDGNRSKKLSPSEIVKYCKDRFN